MWIQHFGNIPLVGYAIEFPPIKNDPGGIYVQGDYNLGVDEDYLRDELEEDEYSGIPDSNKE